MDFIWDSGILHLSETESWHLEFSEFDNMDVFDLKLFILGSDKEFDIYSEDGKMFDQYHRGSYPYYMYDYAAELLTEISKEIRAENDILDFETIIKRVRSRWITKK